MKHHERQDYETYIEGRVLALRRTAYRLTGSWPAAEDLVQDALVKLYLHWRKAAAATSVDAYVRRILVNTYLEQARKPWYRRILSFASPPDRPAPQPDGRSDIESRLDLHAALDRLPAGQRTVLVLRYWEGLGVDDTATALGCAPGTVKSQTSAAIGKLRELLPGHADVSGRPTVRSEK